MDHNVRVIEAPPAVVTTAEVRQHLVELPPEDEAYADALVLAATTWIDGPTGWIGRALGVQVLEWSGSTWPCDIGDLPFPPHLEIVSVVYVDPEGIERAWPVEDLATVDLPAVRGSPGDVKIRYRAGYGTKDTADPPVWTNNIPPPIKVAILMLVAQWYRSREPVAIGATVENLPFAVEALLAPYRVYS